MAINLSINVGAKGNFGSLARALNQLGANVTASQREIAAAAAQTQKQMDGVADTTRLAAQASGVFRTQQVRLRDPMDQLATSIRKGDLSFQGWRRAMVGANEIAGRNNALMKAHIGTVERLDDGTLNATMRLRDWNEVGSTAFQRFGVMSAATKAFSNNMINLGKNIQWGGRQITVGLSVPLGFAAAAAHKAATEIEGEMVRLEKVYTTTAENAEQQLRNLRAEMGRVADMSAQMYGATAAETIQVGADFAAMGYTVETGLSGMINEAQRVQQLGETDLPDAINLVRSVQASWKLETDELADAINRLNAIENQTPLGLKDIATAMPEVAAVAEDLGVRVTYAAGAMAAMREGGLDAGEAAMALRQLLIRITDPTDVARERFQSLGIDLDKLFAGAENGEEKVNRLAIALGNIDAEARVGALSKLVDVRQAARIGIFVDAVNEAAGGAENSWSRSMDVMGMSTEELADDAAHEMQRWRESAVGQAQILNAQIKNELADIGQPLMAVFNSVRGMVVNILEAFNSLGTGTKRTILVMLGIAAVMGPLIMISGVLLNAIASMFKFAGAIGTVITRTQLLTREERVLQAMVRDGIVVQDSYEDVLQRVRQKMADYAATHDGATGNVKEHTAAVLADMEAVKRREGVVDAAAADGDGAVVGAGGRRRGRLRDIGRNNRATRAVGVAGIAGGAAALAGLASMIPGVEGGLQNILNLISQAGMAAMLLGPAIAAMLPAGMALLPVLLAVAAAVAAIVTVFKLWKKQVKATEDSMEGAGEAAQKLAESAGVAWQDVGDVVSEAGEKSAMSFHKANVGAIKEMQRLEGEADRLNAYAFSIAWEMKRHGATDEQIKEQVQRLADAAGVDINMKIVLDYDAENIKTQVGNLVDDIAARQKDQGTSIWSSFKSNMKQMVNMTNESTASLNEATQRGIEDLARMASDALVTGGVEQYAAVMRQAEQDFKNSGMSAKATEQAIALLSRRTIELSDIQGMSTRTGDNYESTLRQLAGGAAEVTRETREWAQAELELITVRKGGVGNWSDSRELNAVNRRNKAIADLEGAGNDAASGLSNAAGAAGELDTELGGAADSADSFQSKLQSSMSSLQGFIADLAMEQIDKMHEAEMDVWDARIDKVQEAHELQREEQEKTHEQEIKDAEAAYDARIKVLQDSIDREEELDRLREFAFGRERRRRQWMQNRTQGGIDVRAAIARGDLDEAARIQQQLASEESDYRMGEVEETRKFEEEQRKKAVNFQIDKIEEAKAAESERLKVEQDLASKRLKTEQELQTKRLRAAKDAAQEANAIEKRRAEWQIRMWQETVAQSEGEYKTHLGVLDGIMKDFGINSIEPITKTYQNIVNDNIYNGFKYAYGRAEAGLREEQKWHDAAVVMREALEAGITGTAFTTNEAERPTPGVARHSGGIIPARARQKGLAQGEVPAVLQSGEYVVQRKAVKNLGVDFLEQLNRYHGGGLIDTLDRWAPAKAVSYTLGQVLGGRELNEAGKLGEAMHIRLGGQGLIESGFGGTRGQVFDVRSFGKTNLAPPDTDVVPGDWRRGMVASVVQKVSSTLAAIPQKQVITSSYRPGAIVKGTTRASLHGSGRAVDIRARARREGGSLADEQMGDSIAATFRKNVPGVSEVLWKTMKGGNHYDHVHVGFRYHKGGLVGTDGTRLSIPALRSGADVNYDNVLANLHRGETVLTSPLSDKLKEGIGQLANGGSTEYNVTIEIKGDVNSDNTRDLARQIRREIETMENRRGPNRRIG